MTYSVVMDGEIEDTLCNHLIRDDMQEDLCFALYSFSYGVARKTAVINEVILPLDNERQIHGNASFNSEYLERVFQLALDKEKGIVFIHSHPYLGWQDMSIPDVIAEKERIAPQSYAITNKPLVGMTVGTDRSWSARFWEKEGIRKYKRKWCENVRVLGEKLAITYNDNLLPVPQNKEELLRTISAWGEETQSLLSRLKIGIVGVGSVGSIVAESLARMGVRHIKLIDFDTYERKNFDRTLGAYIEDLGKSKVEIIANNIERGATADNFICEAIEYSICEEQGYKKALDCDVLFSCVDRPWPRFVLNFIAYGHLIPVIDGGIRVETDNENTKIKRADWRAHTIGSNRPCLECLGQYKSEFVSLEQAGLLDDPSYIKSIEGKGISLTSSENVFGFSLNLSSLEIQQLLSLLICPSGISLEPKIYHFVTGTLEDIGAECDVNCYTKEYYAQGDDSNIKVVSYHEVAEKTRKSRV